ncbi:hypothetical protein ACC806_03680 [Rhizobium ruizarguesonis]
MLKTISNFSYPTFIGVCGAVGTVSDLTEKTDVSFRCAIALLCLGSAILLLPREFVVDRIWKGWLNQEMKNEYGRLAFGTSCLALAALLYGFSTLSLGAQKDGGLIASQFPEIHELKLSLGILQNHVVEVQKVATDIKSDTGKLLEASDRWLDFRLDIQGDTGPDASGKWRTVNHSATPNLFNSTNFQFEDVAVRITSPDNGIVYSKNYKLITDRQDRWEDNGVRGVFTKVVVCVSAKRRGEPEWLVDKQWLELVPQGKADYMIYQKVDASGVRVFDHPTDCDTAPFDKQNVGG